MPRPRDATRPRSIIATIPRSARCNRSSKMAATPLTVPANCFIIPPAMSTCAAGMNSLCAMIRKNPSVGRSTAGPLTWSFCPIRFPTAPSIAKARCSPISSSSGVRSRMRTKGKWPTRSAPTGPASTCAQSTTSRSFSVSASTRRISRTTRRRNISTSTIATRSSCRRTTKTISRICRAPFARKRKVARPTTASLSDSVRSRMRSTATLPASHTPMRCLAACSMRSSPARMQTTPSSFFGATTVIITAKNLIGANTRCGSGPPMCHC